MKKLLLLFPLLLSASTSTITQTITGADGNVVSGTAYIRISAACRSGSNYIGNNTITVPFTAGNFTVNLVPTDGCPTQGSNSGTAWLSTTTYVPGQIVNYSGMIFTALIGSLNVVPGSSKTTWVLISPTYTVSWNITGGIAWTEQWAVPTGGPFTVDQVRISQPAVTNIPVPGPPGPPGNISLLTTNGNNGPSALNTGVLNVPVYVSSLFSSYQFGSNTPITGITNYLQNTYPSIFTQSQSGAGTSGSPYVNALGLASQSQGALFAGPPTGGPGTPGFRAMVAADVPTLNQNTTGNANTASALAVLPSLCSTGFAPTGILANGNATGCAALSSGSITSFSTGNLSPLFTASVANPTSTPTLSFTLSAAAQNSVFAGPPTGGAGAPSYQTAPTFSAANLTNFPTLNQSTTGNAGTATALAALPTPCSSGYAPTGILANGNSTGCTQYIQVFGSQTANYFYAAPNGSAGVPAFRAIVAADIPTLNQNTTGTAAALTSAPSLCSTGSAPTGILANGNATGCALLSGGSLTSFSAGTLSPLFTTSVSNPTSTPALSFVLSNAAQNSVFAGPATGGAGAPSYQTAPVFSAANLTSFPTFNQNTTGTAGGLTGTALGGDVSNSGDTLTVTGLKGTALPSLTAGFLKYSGSAWTFDTNTYLTANQSITVSGDCSGSGATSISLTCTKTNGTVFGTAATQNTGTSGSTIPFLNGTNTWANTQNFSNGIAIGTNKSIGFGSLPFPAMYQVSTNVLGIGDGFGTVEFDNSATTVTIAGAADFHAATHTAPTITVSTVGGLPSTGCILGELAIVTGATLGQQLYENSGSGTCTWTQQLNSGGGGSGSVVLTAGSGGPTGNNCTGPSTSNQVLYVDLTNADMWWCYATNSWKKYLTVSSTGPFLISGATGGTPSTPALGVACQFTTTSPNTLVCVDASGNVTVMLPNVPNVTTTVGTTTISANTCTSPVTTVSMPGLTTGMALNFTPTSDASAVTGWGANGGLAIFAWPTAGQVNYYTCNQATINITPSSNVTFNISAK